MNRLSAFLSWLFGWFLTSQAADEEREQMGPEGRAYDDALRKSEAAYYKEHGTDKGWDFDDKTLKGNE